jgi:hypothetical protein
MADQASDYHRGEMNISEQAATFSLVMGLTKWGSLVIAALLFFLTLWFCTKTGFLGALISAVVAAGVGVLVLRDKAGAAH